MGVGSERIERIEDRQMSLQQDDIRPLPDHTQAISHVVREILPLDGNITSYPANYSSLGEPQK